MSLRNAGCYFVSTRACVACSKSYPYPSSFGSLKSLPKNEIVTGRPSLVTPAGTIRSGKPVSLAKLVAEAVAVGGAGGVRGLIRVAGLGEVGWRVGGRLY